jgi:hypothetical protein
MTRHWLDPIRTLEPCRAALEWLATQPDAATAWATCERGDWMLWLAGRYVGEPGSDARRPLALAACACARLALPVFEARHPDDQRPRQAVETAEAWARGAPGVTLDTVRASSAAYATYASAYAAASATASFAAASVAASAAASAAASVAAASAAASFAAASAAASAVTRTDMLRRCADLVRQYYPLPPIHPET